MMAGSPSTQQQPKKVLLVGTGAVVANTVSSVLPGWTLIRVSDNKAALSLLQKECADLVVTGEHSNGREDVELLRKIRRVWPHTRLIILTDESTPADVIAAIRFRAFSYFSKPYTQEAFADMLRLASEAPAWDDGIELISATPAWIVLTARCDLATAERVFQFGHEIADLPEAEQERVGMAFREMLLNAMEHGGHFDPSKHVEISYTRARHVVKAAEMHEADYSPWEDRDLACWPATTLLRGKIVVDKGAFTGSLGDGQHLSRKVAEDVRSRPAV